MATVNVSVSPIILGQNFTVTYSAVNDIGRQDNNVTIQLAVVPIDSSGNPIDYVEGVSSTIKTLLNESTQWSGTLTAVLTASEYDSKVAEYQAASVSASSYKAAIFLYTFYYDDYTTLYVPVSRGYSKCKAPTSVTLSKTSAAPNESVTLSWSGADNGTNNAIKGYQVARSTSASGSYTVIGTVNTSNKSGSLAVTAPSGNGSQYFYKVYTIGTVSGYNSDISIAYATLTATYSPVTISNVAFDTDHVKNGNATLRWTAGAGTNNPITGFDVYQDSTLYTTLGSAARQVDLPCSSTEGGIISYRVYVKGTYGNAVASPSINLYRYTDVTEPTLVTATPENADPGVECRLDWSGAGVGSNNNITGYEIWRKADDENAFTLLTSVTSTSSSGSYTFNAPSEAGVVWSFKVRTVGEYSTSAMSEATAQVSTVSHAQHHPPTNVRLTAYNVNPEEQVTLMWDAAVPGEGTVITGYQVFRSSSPIEGFESIGSTTTLAMQVRASAISGNTFYYRVKTLAQDAELTSGFSDYVVLQTSTDIIVDYSVPVSEAFHTAIQNHAPQHLKIHFFEDDVDFDESDLVSDGLHYETFFCSETDLTVGLTPSASVSFALFNIDGQLNSLHWGKFSVDIGVEIGNDETEWARLGIFWAERPRRVFTSEVEVTGVDAMAYLCEKSTAEMQITFPITLAELLDAVCEFIGLEHKVESFINQGRTLTEQDDFFQYTTAREVIGFIAEAACSNAMISYNGKLIFAWLHETDTLVSASDYSYCATEEFQVSRIDKLQIRNSDTDIGVLIGTGTNGYVIQQNPVLVFDSDAEGQSYAQPIYERLTSVQPYTPISLEWFGDWAHRPGDVINVDYEGTIYRLPIFSMSLDWAGVALLTVNSTGREKREELTAQARETYQIGRKLTEINKTIDGIKIQISEYSGGNDYYTLIDANAKNITSLASSVERLQQADGQIIERVDKAEQAISATEIVSTVRSSEEYVNDLAGKANANGSELLSMIRQTAQGVWIQGNEINLNGTVTSNGYFKIYQDGHMECKNAVVSGELNAGNWTFNSNGGTYTDPTNSNNKAKITTSGTTAIYKTTGLDAQYGADPNHTTTIQGNYVKLFCENAGYGILVCNSNSHNLGNIDYEDPTLICDKASNSETDNDWSTSAGNIGTRRYRWDIGWIRLLHTSAQWIVSSRKNKHDIEKLPDMGDKIDQLVPVRFTYNWEKKPTYGLILEDTNDVLPEICSMPDDNEEGSINYTALIPVLLREIQSLRKRVSALEERG